LHVVTADTFGTAAKMTKSFGLECHVLPKKKVEAEEKLDYINSLGSEKCVVMGNGNNDYLMLENAGLGIAVLGREGIATQCLFAADLVVLAAGGLGTPAILQESGIACEPTLFVDPVLCVAAERPGALQNREIPMPFAVQRDGYILSPYFDYLSYFFDRRWRPPADDTLSLMIKLADSCRGTVEGRRVRKGLSDADRRRLEGAVDLCVAILGRLGIRRDDVFMGTLNAGHPGGMLPLGPGDAESLHSPRLPRNLYVADATLLPESLGNPPILTIMALALRVARAAREAIG